MKSREERFWGKVEKGEGCWLWTGATAVYGYGHMRTGSRTSNRMELAHRISWELANGRPPVGPVCHTCDNPPCVNPAHLYEGSAASNARDRETRGRTGNTKVTENEVRLMRSLRERGWTYQRIADEFGLSNPTAWAIVTRKAWKHVV